jgi:hypothetical protein
MGRTSAKAWCLVELYRRRANARKLALLEVAILRHAPFADCARTIWQRLPKTRWYEQTLPQPNCIREYRSTREAVAVSTPYEPFTKVNGHRAIEMFEGYFDGLASSDDLVHAQEYFRMAEWSAEADRFHTPDDQRDELETQYGIADWLKKLLVSGPESFNVIDFYLANYSGTFYRWAGFRPLHPNHHAVVLTLIHDLFGWPLNTVTFAPEWRTSTTVALAESMYAARDFGNMPILADALEEAGCDNADILTHCRGDGPHVRGCWVVDLVLGKS